MTPSPPDPAPERTALASPKADLRELNVNTRATVAELQAFLQELKGKSPQEMLGLVAASHLARALVLATILVFAAIVVFTAIPFIMNGGEEMAAAAETPEAAPAGQPAETPAEAAPANPAPAETTPPPAADLSKLGVGEEKTAPPNVNPLENKDDKFLEGLD